MENYKHSLFCAIGRSALSPPNQRFPTFNSVNISNTHWWIVWLRIGRGVKHPTHCLLALFADINPFGAESRQGHNTPPLSLSAWSAWFASSQITSTPQKYS